MPIEQRAKQFMPFAALKGFEREIEKREKTACEKRILSEDMLERLNYKMNSVDENSNVSVVYFENGQYVQQQGWVEKKDTERRKLRVCDVEIDYDDIYDLEIL